MHRKSARSKAYVSVALLFLILFLLRPKLFSADVCDKTLTATNGPLGYDSRDDNRCEGMYTKKVAGAFVVVSYLIGELNFELRKDVVLEVSTPHTSSETIHVRGVAIPLETYYQLDGILPMSWPIGEVLHPAKLNATKLGVYGWIRSDPVMYVPLRIAQRGSPLQGESSNRVVMSLRPSTHIENVEWRYAPVVNGKCLKPSEWRPVYNTKFGLHEKDSRFRRGEVVRIDLTDVKKGELCLKLIADEQENAHEVNASIRVINPETR